MRSTNIYAGPDIRAHNYAGNSPGGRGRGPCAAEYCRELTEEGKAYCLTHIDRMPHVERLLVLLAVREAEAEAVAKRGLVDMAGELVAEVIAVLRVEPVDGLGRLSKRLSLDYAVTVRVVMALAAQGKVRLTRISEKRERVEAVA